MPFVGWDVGEENEPSSPQAIYKNVMSKVHNGAIVMSHDTQTVANAYARIVPDLIKRGYRLVTVPQLKGDLEPGLYDSN
jgi:peptidoglycan/xylan/chitin deacetylase (PgdA/CDA1 family)